MCHLLSSPRDKYPLIVVILIYTCIMLAVVDSKYFKIARKTDRCGKIVRLIKTDVHLMQIQFTRLFRGKKIIVKIEELNDIHSLGNEFH